jgi:4-oxalocrotonate tautomerase
MPIIQIHMLSGRSPAQKKAFIEQVAAVAVRTLDVPEHAVTTVITEVAPDSWGSGSRPMAEIRAAGPRTVE